MVDMTKTVAPKSDQLNFDDFVGGQTKTIEIIRVTGSDNADQPVNLFYKGDNGKPYKPCKSMRRALIALWGPDGQKYVGRMLTLFGDPEVAFGGVKVGGIRISHASHISDTQTIALTTTRGHRKGFTVKPLKTNGTSAAAASVPPLSEDMVDAGRTAAMGGTETYAAWAASLTEEQKTSVRAHHNKEWSGVARRADEAAKPSPEPQQEGLAI